MNYYVLLLGLLPTQVLANTWKCVSEVIGTQVENAKFTESFKPIWSLEIPPEVLSQIKSHPTIKKMITETNSGEGLHLRFPFLTSELKPKSGFIGEGIQSRFIYEVLRETLPELKG